MPAIRTFSVALILSLVASTSFAADGIAWQTDVDAARVESHNSNRPLLMFVTSSNCPYCVKMLNETFRNDAVIAEINEHFVPVRIDRGTQPELERKLAVKLYPTLVIADDAGVEVRRMTGYISASSITSTLAKINAEWLAARPGTTVK